MISLIDCETKRVFPIGYSNKQRKRVMEHFKIKLKKIRTHLSMGGVNHQVLSYLNTRYFYFLVIIDEIQLCNFWSIQDLSLFKVQFLLQKIIQCTQISSLHLDYAISTYYIYNPINSYCILGKNSLKMDQNVVQIINLFILSLRFDCLVYRKKALSSLIHPLAGK